MQETLKNDAHFWASFFRMRVRRFPFETVAHRMKIAGLCSKR